MSVGPEQQRRLRASKKAEIAERKGKGKGRGGSKGAKAKAKAKSKTKSNVKVKQTRVQAAAPEALKADDEPRKLGCPTCRWSAGGCHICRRPGYKPRGPHKNPKKAAPKKPCSKSKSKK